MSSEKQIMSYNSSDEYMSEYQTESSETDQTESEDDSDQSVSEEVNQDSSDKSSDSDQNVSEGPSTTVAASKTIDNFEKDQPNKNRKRSYSLEPQNISPEMKQFFHELKMFWTRNHNLQRGTAAITVTTFEKAKERMSCEYRHV